MLGYYIKKLEEYFDRKCPRPNKDDVSYLDEHLKLLKESLKSLSFKISKPTQPLKDVKVIDGSNDEHLRQNFDWTNYLKEIIMNTFKHSGYLPHQQEVINATLNNLNVIAVMPTGGGKKPHLSGRIAKRRMVRCLQIWMNRIAKRLNVRCL
ncbi:putative DNA helicase [Helianthus annuus]|uniref:DNA helicase n=1 Tax=Helianthus annuus TaxID=4232 RepID=A0A251RRJ0_HELAN|nr:putative DNA helicase [Helianthus annuus]KAJ0429375.1 putative DNA helicase [Helianthus annuus]KAJ0636448.1 putative DNA helicase [Helianthus annuus]KAJ0667947.1 putative DNA helicase [Helianthus annuus]